jgi:hypothetical protein
MPWFKVDDTFAMHDKALAAGNAAIGLWTRAGSWSMQQLTDGFVPDHIIRVIGSARERKRLVNAGLWTERPGGVQFVNWSERQPTREQVETARQAAKERQRHARERAKSQRESRRDTSVSHGPPDPTRPDPIKKEEANASSSARKRATRIAEDWIPTEKVRAALAEQYPTIDLKHEHAKFIDYWLAKSGKDATKLDWDATFRNWIRNAADRLPARPATQQSSRDWRNHEEPPAEVLSDPDAYTQWVRDRARRTA